MSMRHNEDRELDIKIAELQADIQIYLTITFGLFGVFAAAAFCFLQIMWTVEPVEIRIILGVLAVIASFLSAYSAYYFARRVKSTRDKIRDLRMQYVW